MIKHLIIIHFNFQELLAQCLLFLLAGYETTSTTLAYIMYEMAVNPKVQKALQDEIDQFFPEDVSLTKFDIDLNFTKFSM